MLNGSVILIAILGAISAASFAYVFLFQRIESAKKTTSRMSRVKYAETDHVKISAARDRVAEMSKRRRSVQESLKGIEKKQEENTRKASRSIRSLLLFGNIPVSVTMFYVYSGIFALIVFLVVLLAGAPLWVAGLVTVISAGLVPRLTILYLFNRRMTKFRDEFPNALDVMVRSIRSGLPLNDALELIASDSQEPVKSEFQRVVDSQQVGFTVTEACMRMQQNIPLMEVNFFSIVIGIHAQAGGNLSEALGNLSRVLRERRKLGAKVKSLSSESKASAWIIGLTPIVMGAVLNFASPGYVTVLFTDFRGQIMVAASAVWMLIGILVMRQMVNFKV